MRIAISTVVLGRRSVLRTLWWSGMGIAGGTVATVTAVSPGTVVLSAHGRTTCPSGGTGCVVRSVTWSWVLRVAAPGAEPIPQSKTP